MKIKLNNIECENAKIGYPIIKMGKTTGAIVVFTALRKGVCLLGGNTGSLKPFTEYHNLIPATDSGWVTLSEDQTITLGN